MNRAEVPIGALEAAATELSQAGMRPGRLTAVVLRVRLERLVAGSLPTSVAEVQSVSAHVERRLMATVGKPGLDREAQDRADHAVRRAVTAYGGLSRFLHGRTVALDASPSELAEWRAAIELLEAELSLRLQ